MEYLTILVTKMKVMIRILEYLDLMSQLRLKDQVSEYHEEKLRVKELAKTTELMRKNAKNSCRINSLWRYSKYEN